MYREHPELVRRGRFHDDPTQPEQETEAWSKVQEATTLLDELWLFQSCPENHHTDVDSDEYPTMTIGTLREKLTLLRLDVDESRQMLIHRSKRLPVGTIFLFFCQ